MDRRKRDQCGNNHVVGYGISWALQSPMARDWMLPEVERTFLHGGHTTGWPGPGKTRLPWTTPACRSRQSLLLRGCWLIGGGRSIEEDLSDGHQRHAGVRGLADHRFTPNPPRTERGGHETQRRSDPQRFTGDVRQRTGPRSPPYSCRSGAARRNLHFGQSFALEEGTGGWSVRDHGARRWTIRLIAQPSG